MIEGNEDTRWRKGSARLHRTDSALIARGIDSELAEKLRRSGETLNSLKMKTPAELDLLGVSRHAADNILKGARPPIPFPDLARVLIANRFTCCVCRDHGRSVIVHHIKQWAESRDHSTANLAVLCMDDHDRAHKIGRLTQNLTPALVHEFKASWERDVARMDARAVLNASATESESWWLFNHVRLLELADSLGIDLAKIRGFSYMRRAGILGSDGRPTAQGQAGYVYEGEHGMSLYAYGRSILNEVLDQLSALNISDDLDRGFLTAVVKRGHFLVVQGSFVFKRLVPWKDGPGQTLLGTRKANGVEIYFTADRWEATSNSARCCWLGGRQDAVCLLRVMSIGYEAENLRIGTTALAIGASLPGLRTREYANVPYRAGYYMLSEEDEDEEDLFDDMGSSHGPPHCAPF